MPTTEHTRVCPECHNPFPVRFALSCCCSPACAYQAAAKRRKKRPRGAKNFGSWQRDTLMSRAPKCPHCGLRNRQPEIVRQSGPICEIACGRCEKTFVAFAIAHPEDRRHG